MAFVALNPRRVPLSVPGSLLGVSAETRVDKDLFFVRSLHRFVDRRDLIGMGLFGWPNPESVISEGLVPFGPAGASIEAVVSGCDSLRLRTGTATAWCILQPASATNLAK